MVTGRISSMHLSKKSAYPWLLFIFVLVYPLLFFPGTLFGRPPIITPLDNIMASEQFLYLPKLLFLLGVGVLGLLEVRRLIAPSTFLLLISLHLVLAVLSTLNARDSLAFNLLGPSQRFDGILYQAGLFAVGAFAYITLKSAPQHLRSLVIALVLGCSIQSVVLLSQGLGMDPVTPLRLWETPNMPLGTLGHPGMAAAYLLPGLLLALWYSLMAEERRYRHWWFGAALLIATGLGITSNASAFYALIATLVLANILKRSWRLLLLSCLLLLAVLIPRTFSKETQSYTGTATFQTRLIIWQIALRAISETPFQPILGGGPDALRLAQLRNPPLDLLIKEYALEFGWPEDAVVKRAYIKEADSANKGLRDHWLAIEFEQFGGSKNVTKEYSFAIDRAHNYILDRWLAYGLISVGIWLVLFLRPIYQSFYLQNCFGWAFIALMIYYLAWFPVMQVEPIHLVLLAAAWARPQPQ